MPAPDYSVSYQPTPLVEIKRELEEKAEHDIVSSILEESAKDETTVVSTVRTKEHDKKKESSKGQWISEWIYEAIVSPKIWTKHCPDYTGQKSWQFFVRIYGETMTSLTHSEIIDL